MDLSSRRRSAACPSCQHHPRAANSTYRRTVADLPLAGATLILHLQVRRFFCRHAACPQRIFAERFPTLVPVRGRHSRGVHSALRHVGLAVGGRAGAQLTRALGIPGSFRTMVRLVQRAPQVIQVIDRFHLVRNLHDALERFFLRYRRDLNTLGASLRQSSELTPTPAMISQARHTRWIHRYHEIQRLRPQHLGIAAIARQVQVSRPTVYRYLAMPQPPERQRSRHRGPRLMTPFIP
jgi:transposase